jgi:hypothetical protein
MSAAVWDDADTAGPLAGVRVVDFGQYLAGPLTGMLLADQGATVVRVDPPGGPRWSTPLNTVLLRGRRRVTLDLTDRRDRDRARRLIASADVLIESFRPGTMERLGIGPEGSLARAPGLVYCSLPGFGSDDPRRDVPAWEGVVMAAGGAYSLRAPNSFISGHAGMRFSPLPLASVFGALEAAMAVAAALVARHRDGLGQILEVPLSDAPPGRPTGRDASGARRRAVPAHILGARRRGRVDVARPGPQRPDRELVASGRPGQVEAEEASGVVPGDEIDLVIGHTGRFEVRHEQLR